MADFWKRFLNPTPRSDRGPFLLDVPNRHGAGDGAPFAIDPLPHLESIFRSDNPPAPFRTPPPNWDRKSAKEKRVAVGMAYCKHPVPLVRLKTIQLMRNEKSFGMSQCLVDLLCDDDPEVQKAAADCLWSWHGDDGCRFAALALRDEIRGYAEPFPGHQSDEGLWLGRDAAVRALDFLVASAPSEQQRAAIQEIIDHEIIIDERIKEVDTRSVKFVGQEEKGPYTYEVYRAKGREQALAFLKHKSVTRPNYYIEVETMDGNFGRDIRGIYAL